MRRILAPALALAACVTAACGDVRTPETKSDQKAASPSSAFSPMDPNMARASSRQTGECSIDLVNGKPAGEGIVLRAGATARIEGWAADRETKSVPARAALLLRGSDRSYYAYAQRGLVREDVAKNRGIAEFAKSGYAVSASTEAVQPGDYSAQIVQETSSGQTECKTGKTIKVTAQ